MDAVSDNNEVPERNSREDCSGTVEGGDAAPGGDVCDIKECKNWEDVGKLYEIWAKSQNIKFSEEPNRDDKTSTYKKRCKGWFMTINNPTKDDFKALNEDKLAWSTGQIEVGDKCGTPHIQVTIYYENARIIPVKRYPRASIYPCRNIAACRNYCNKGYTRVLGPFSFGVEPKQGKREDLKALHERMKEGESVDEILLNDPYAYHEFGRTLNALKSAMLWKPKKGEIDRGFMTQGVWIYGPTNCAKSHCMMELCKGKTFYMLPNDGGWWDNYEQQEVLCLNDFRGDIVSYNRLLQLVDKWLVDDIRRRGQAPIYFRSKLVIVTSSLPPDEIFIHRNTLDALEQLDRRFEIVHKTIPFNKQNKARIDEENKKLIETVKQKEIDLQKEYEEYKENNEKEEIMNNEKISEEHKQMMNILLGK